MSFMIQYCNNWMNYQCQDAKLTGDQKNKRLRSQELEEMDIVATAFLILIAGYDTTSQALSYAGEALYNLFKPN